jgi:hypothetical protein
VAKQTPYEQLIDASFSNAAAKSLGPFEIANKSSQLRGCR